MYVMSKQTFSRVRWKHRSGIPQLSHVWKYGFESHQHINGI